MAENQLSASLLRPPRPMGEKLMRAQAYMPISLSLLLVSVLTLSAYVPRAGAGASAQTTGAADSAAIAQSVADFYRGKTITIVVGFPPGGGFDAMGRLLARYLGKYVPGEPDVIVENMPGAGSLTAANHLYTAAAPDGLTIGTFDQPLLIGQLVGEEDVQFDGRQFGWLGSAWNEATVACQLRTDSPYTTVDALMRQDLPPVVVGAIPGGVTELFPKMLNAMLGTNFRVVSDYSGAAPLRLAVESGEVQGRCGSYAAFLATAQRWVEENFVRIPIYNSDERNVKLEELYPEAVRAEDLTDDAEAKQLLRALIAPGAIAKFFVVPPGLPPERLRALQEAFWAAMQDEDLQAEAEQARFEFDAKPAVRVIEIVNELLNMPADVVERLREIRKG